MNTRNARSIWKNFRNNKIKTMKKVPVFTETDTFEMMPCIFDHVKFNKSITSRYRPYSWNDT